MANAPHKFKNGVAITGSAKVDGDEVLTEVATQTIQNKTIDASNTIAEAALPSAIDAAKIADGSVSNTEFQYLNGVTSSIQDQLNDKIDDSEKGAANGVATLNSSGKLSPAQVPAIAITETFVVANITARDALVIGSADGEVQEGDVAVVTDASSDPDVDSGGASYIYDGTAWQRLITPDSAVTSVNGQTGVVSLDLGDLGDVSFSGLTSNQILQYNGTEWVNAAAPVEFSDSTFRIQDDVDSSKELAFQVSSISASTTRTITVPDADVNLGALANTNLSNLQGPTAINQALLPQSSATFDIGSGSLRFNNLFMSGNGNFVGNIISIGNSSTIGGVGFSPVGAIPSGVSNAGRIFNTSLSNIVALHSANNTTTNSQNVHIETGNATGASGDSGSVIVQIGTSANGSRGSIRLVDGSEGTVGHVWTSKGVNGEGEWAPIPAAPVEFSDDVFRIQDDVDSTKKIAFQASAISTATTRTVSVPDADVDLAKVNNAILKDGSVVMEADLDIGQNAVKRVLMITDINSNNSIDPSNRELLNGGVAQLTWNVNDIDVHDNQIVNVADPTNPQDAATKAYVDTQVASFSSPGDIVETVFALSNNQTTPADVTGLLFNNSEVRSFKALISVEIDATLDLFEVFEILGIQKTSGWDISVNTSGDNSEVNFSITSSGQIQYTSGNYAGFVDGDIKFRAITTSI